MELRGYRRANKPIFGLFSRHYFIQSASRSKISSMALVPPLLVN